MVGGGDVVVVVGGGETPLVVVHWSQTDVGCVASTFDVVVVVEVVVPASRRRSLGMASLAVACGEHTWKVAVWVVVAFVAIVVVECSLVAISHLHVDERMIVVKKNRKIKPSEIAV